MKFQKLAILYDWIDKWGGAERILQLMFDTFPKADWYTIYADYKGARWAQKYQSRINTTDLQKFYQWIPFKSLLAPLMPIATETLDLTKYDTVFSISSSFIKGVITRPETKHICYLFTPTRFLWHERQAYYSDSFILRPLTAYLRNWDYIAGQKPDQIITLSTHSQELIKKYYRRESEVIYPPFSKKEWDKYMSSDSGAEIDNLKLPNYFLFVGRLEPYKRVDLLIKVFKKRQEDNLIILGKGSIEKKLRRMSRGWKNIHFIGEATEAKLAKIYQKAKALIMPQAEDFGYTALESICFQTPVIAYKYSGTGEIVRHGKTGFLFEQQTPGAIMTALENFSTLSYNFKHFDWDRFNKKRFINRIKQLVK